MKSNPLTSSQAKRNQSMECCKLIASFFVVCIHVPFSGKFGDVVYVLGSFAVPLFFLITGYFNYQAREEDVLRRLKHAVMLLCVGTVADMLSSCIMVELNGGSTIARLIQLIPEMDEIMNMLVRHYHPYVSPLWYLIALIFCYTVFWGYTVFWKGREIDYRSFYQIAGCLAAITLAFGMVQPAQGVSPHVEVRNGWFLGLPFFGAGLFIRQYQQRIFENFHPTTGKLLILIVLGAYISVQEAFYIGAGVLPLGVLIEVFALMLLLVAHPQIAGKNSIMEKLISNFGYLSTVVFIVHITCLQWYESYFQQPLIERMGDMEGMCRPIVIILMSLTVGIIWKQIWFAFKKWFLKRKK